MIFAIVLLLFVGAIAYFHWIQGILSGFISAVIAVISASVALGYYEPLANVLSGGKFQDSAHAVCLIALFALTYIILRVIFDKAVPGNIRIPSTADKVGGAIFGAIAGIFACGIVAIAAQTLPFDSSVMGYSRYATKEDRSVTFYLEEGGRSIDRTVKAELTNDDLEKGQQGLLLPLDDMVVGMVSHLSNKGALSNGKPFKSIHPDLMQELFGQRIGIETTAKHTANNAKENQVTVEQINLIDKPLPRRSGEIDEIRKLAQTTPLSATANQQIVSMRVKFASGAADDNVVRFSPAAVRLVTRDPDREGEWKNNFPVGTLQDGKVLWVNKPDDYLFVNLADNAGADLVFLVDKGAFFDDPASLAEGKARIADGVFLEFKRMAKVDLQGVTMQLGFPQADPKYNVARKTRLLKAAPAPAPVVEAPQTPSTPAPPQPQPAPPDPAPAAAAGDNGWDKAPLEQPNLVTTTKLNVRVNVESADPSGELASDAVTASWKEKKFVELEVDANSSNAVAEKLQAGGYLIEDFMIPAGKRMVHVRFAPKARADSWAWSTNLADFAVYDGKEAYKPHGAYAEIMQAGGIKKILMRYDANKPVPTVKKAEGVVSVVQLIYLIPEQSKAVEIQYQGKAGGPKLGQ